MQGGDDRALTWSRDDRLTALIAAVLLGLLYLTRLHSYLLFHTLAEIVFIVVCLTVLIMALALRQFLDDDFALFLGITLAAVAVLHTLHVVDYPGVNMISDSLDPPTQLWLSARLLLAGTFIVAPFVIGKRLNLLLVLLAYAAYVAVSIAAVYWWRVFPGDPGRDRADALQEGDRVRHLSHVRCSPSHCFGAGETSSPTSPGDSCGPHSSPVSWPSCASRSTTRWPPGPTCSATSSSWFSALLFFRAVVDDGLARPHAIAMANLREAEDLHRRLEVGLMPSAARRARGPGRDHQLPARRPSARAQRRLHRRTGPRRGGRGRDLRRRQWPRPQRRRPRRHAARQLAGPLRRRRRPGGDRRKLEVGPVARAPGHPTPSPRSALPGSTLCATRSGYSTWAIPYRS